MSSAKESCTRIMTMVIWATLMVANALPAWAAAGNLALHREAVASSDITAGRAANVVDGNTDTYWQPLAADRQDGSVWIHVDLGAPTAISQVILRLEDMFAQRVEKHELLYSNDASDWTTVYTQVASERPVKSGEAVSFETVTARYVQLLIFIPDLNFRLQEFEIYK